MTIKELQELQEFFGITYNRFQSHMTVERRLPLKELQRRVGIFPEDGKKAARKKVTLAKIQRQVSRGYISAARDIRMIFKHTLWRSAADIEACVRRSTGVYFRNVQRYYTGTSVAAEDITLLDVLVFTDWTTAHIERYTYAKEIMTDLLKLAERDIWFANLLNISINALRNFPNFKLDAAKREVFFNWIGISYRGAFGKQIDNTITIGKTLSGIKKMLETAWWVDMDINSYQFEIVNCGRLIWSIIHLICAGYVNIEDRVSETDYPYRSFKNLLERDNRYRGRGGTVQEIHDP